MNAGESSTAAILLGLETLHEEVTVRAQTDSPGSDHRSARRADDHAVDGDRSHRERALPGRASTDSGRRARAGRAVEHQRHAAAIKSALTFNNANGTDPVTGEDAVELPIDAVSTVQVRGAAFAPEFGLSAGAVTTVETQRAGDAWHVTVNDLEPRPRLRAGEFRGVESWTPRLTTGGPIVKGKLSLLESMQYG